MASPASNNTANKILDVAQALIQRRGYNAISFKDIAEEVGIRKPSIVHHFASKEALGQAVVKRYREDFNLALQSLFENSDKGASAIFDLYCGPYLDFGETKDKICLCGALAGEFKALPASVQSEVSLFFDEHVNWLQKIIVKGRNSGEFTSTEAEKDLAMHILDSLQGALMIKRATGNSSHLQNTIKLIKERL